MGNNDHTTRSLQLTTSLYFDSLHDYRAAGAGKPTLINQVVSGVDNGYGLQGNPTLQKLQDSISALEHGSHTLLFPSGLTALIALSALLSSGDHWLIPDIVYAPVRRYAQYLQERFGISYDMYSVKDLSTLKRAIRDTTKLIHIESPGSATFEVTDIDAVVEVAKSREILTSEDNTWAAGVLSHPLDYGVDISILSLTKYPAGYSDVFMGSVTTRSETLFKKLSYYHRIHGYTVSPFSAMLVQRGLETLKVRLLAHGNNARRLLHSMKNSKKIPRIYFVDGQKGNITGTNGLFSVELDRVYTDAELDRLFSTLSVFKIGESWGGTHSLVLPFQPTELSSRLDAPKNTLVRFHAGLEDPVLQTKDIELFIRALEHSETG